MEDKLAQALRDCFISPNVVDSNLESANLVDTTNCIAQQLARIATALEKLAEKE